MSKTNDEDDEDASWSRDERDFACERALLRSLFAR